MFFFSLTNHSSLFDLFLPSSPFLRFYLHLPSPRSLLLFIYFFNISSFLSSVFLSPLYASTFFSFITFTTLSLSPSPSTVLPPPALCTPLPFHLSSATYYLFFHLLVYLSLFSLFFVYFPGDSPSPTPYSPVFVPAISTCLIYASFPSAVRPRFLPPSLHRTVLCSH